MQDDQAKSASQAQGHTDGASSAGTGAPTPASGHVRSALRGQSFAAQEATLAPRPVQRKRSSGAAVQMGGTHVGASAHGVELQGSLNLPNTDVAYAAFPGFTTKWTLSGGCGWKLKPRLGRRPANQDTLELSATGGPIEFGGAAPAAEGAPAEAESHMPEVEGEANTSEIELSIKQELLGGHFDLGGNVEVGEHGVGGGVTATCNPGSIRLSNGVVLRAPAINLKLADYDPETGELSICRLETKFPITSAKFTLHLPHLDVEVSPHLELKFKLEPNWFAIAEQLGLELAADAGVGEAAMAVATSVGVDLLACIVAPLAAGGAMLAVASHEFEEGDALVDAANSTASHVYSYCQAYAHSWISGRPSHGPGGNAARRDMDAARAANPGIQIAREAARQGEEAIYRRVYEIVSGPAIEAMKARVRASRFLRGSEELTIEDRVHQAQWGGGIWRVRGRVPPPRATRNQPEPEAESAGGGEGGEAHGGGSGGHGGGGGHGGARERAPASPGVDANSFDPAMVALTARGAELARIHRREQGLLSRLNGFKESALMYERQGAGASATVDELITFYRDRYVPKVLALRRAYRALHVSEGDWKVHPTYANRREYDPNLIWAKSMADATVGVAHPHDPRLRTFDGFIRELRS